MAEIETNNTVETPRDAIDTYDVIIRTSTVELSIPSEDIEELWFVEDIYAFCMRGRLVFNDRISLIEFGGMSGTEIIEIVYGTDEKKKSVFFHTHKTITIPKNESESRIEMSLIDVSFKRMNYHTYSLSFEAGSKYTDLVKELALKYFGIENYQMFEDCKEELDTFDTSNTTPTDNIRWLLDRCSGSKSGQAGYLLYQNTTEKQWNLTTLEGLLIQTKNMNLFDKNEVYTNKDVNSSYINKIQGYRIKGISNKDLPILSRGYLLGYDPMTKRFHHEVYSYLQAIDRFTILGKHSLFENFQVLDYLNSEAEPINTGETDEKIMENIWFGKWIKKYCTQQLIEISVKGHEDRYAGGMIDVVWESNDQDTEKVNQSLNGKHLIKSITHHFDKNAPFIYQQSLVLIKNGYGDKQEGQFIKSKKWNI